MNDKLSASWVLVVGSLFLAYWYYRTKRGGGADRAGGPPVLPPVPGTPNGPKLSIIEQIEAIGSQFGLPVTSTTGGKHVAGSLHYQGRAVDFGVGGFSEDVLSAFKSAEEAAGFQVHEEYAGSTPYSTGHHLHVSKPFSGGGW